MFRVFGATALAAAMCASALAQSPQTVPAPVPQPAPQAQPSATQQQQVQVDVPAPWRVECANTGTVLECQTSQSAVLRQSQQILATVTVRIPSAPPRQPVIVVLVPLGVRVTDPVTLAVDETSPERLTVQGCTNNGCFAGGPVAPAVVERMRSGQNVRVSFANVGGDTVAVTMPLRGFTLAHDKIR